MTKCPLAKTAKSGECRGPGCNHGTAEHATICRCCLLRAGETLQRRAELARTMGTKTKLAELEAEAMALLVALGPDRRPGRHHRRSFGDSMRGPR